MDIKDIASKITAIAPAIGTAIGGPAGSVVGLGVQALAKVFGLDAKSDDIDDQINAAVQSMTPEQAVALKTADNQFKMEMKKLGVDVFKLEVQDKDSARAMQIKTQSFVPATLTFVLAVIAAFLVYMVMTSQMDKVDKTLVGTVIGYVFSELKQATSFWFGSSKGSHDKTILSGGKNG